ISQWTKRQGFAVAAYYNLVAAAISTFPVLATGILAWQFQLEGAEAQRNSFAAFSTGMRLKCDDLAGVVGALPRSTTDSIPAEQLFHPRVSGSQHRALTGHLGGVVSGVIGPG